MKGDEGAVANGSELASEEDDELDFDLDNMVHNADEMLIGELAPSSPPSR